MRKTFTVAQGFKALLLAGGASAIVLATPVYAQDEDEEDDPIIVTGSRIQRAEFDNNSPTVTVDQEFLQNSSTSAVEQSLNKLPQFVVSQSSTVKNNSPTGLLPAGGDIQPNATNTPGAATISLRGVGSNRSLVLINGRRGTPANATGVIDVSTIPSSALQRVEIISGGASATYGADALAGVTNFILKDDFEGLELDATLGMDQNGNGIEYQISGIMGTDFADGRGNISLAMSMNTRELMLQRDNPFYQDLWNNPDTTAGSFFFLPRPGVSGLSLPANGVCEGLPEGCILTDIFSGANPPVPNNTGSIYMNGDGSFWVGGQTLFVNEFNQRGGTAFFEPWARDDEIGAVWSLTSNGTLKAVNALTPQTIPTTRYNFYAQGNYEINDWLGMFAEASFSHSDTYTVQEAVLAQFGWDVILPWGDDVYTGAVPGFSVVIPGLGDVFNNAPYQNPAVPASVLVNGDGIQNFFGFYDPYVDPTPNDLTDNPNNPAFEAIYAGMLPCATPGDALYTGVGGCSNTQAFEQVIPAQIQELLNASNANRVVLAGALPAPRETFSDVKTYSMTAGFEGYVPGTDWTWEAFVSHSSSQTFSRQKGFYSLQRERALFTSPNMGQGFSFTSNGFSGLGGLAPFFGATTGTCTTGLNFFQGYQGTSQDCVDAITTTVSNRGTTRQTIAEFNAQGGLFDLPAGQVRGAIGASYREQRYEFVNETDATIGTAFLDSIVGIYPSANMENQGYDVKEVYGELLIPVLSDVPGIQEFNLELGGRISDYNTSATTYTFKVLGDWQVTDWLRIRGGFNRAERAPNIAELLLTPQQTFATDPIGDVCSQRNQSTSSANPNANTSDALDVMAMCLALMERDNNGIYVPYDDPDSFYNPDQLNTRQPAGTGGGGSFPIAVGNQYYRENINPNVAPLKSEIADTWTVGAVINSPFASDFFSRFSLTVDYWNIRIEDPIGNSGGGGVLLRCVSPDFNPAAAGVAAGASSPDDLDDPAIRAAAAAALATSSCPDVFRTPTVGSANQFGTFNAARVITTYDNDGLIQLSGIDANLNWSGDVGPGTLFASLNGTYTIEFSLQPFTGTPLIDYVGTQGTGLKGVNFGSAFEYRLLGNIGYTYGPATVSLQWQHIPATEDSGDAAFYNGLAPALNNIAGIPAYNLFNLNASYQVTDNVRVRLNVDNLFNKRPPLSGYVIEPGAGQLPGGNYSFFHDIQGRRFAFGVNGTF